MLWRLIPVALILVAIGAVTVGCIGQVSQRVSGTSAANYPADVLKGGGLYAEYACVQCHGVGGRSASALRGTGPSLVSNEFKRTFPKGVSYDSALVSVIRNGMISENDRAASMPAWNGILSEEDMLNIVAYIRASLPDVGVPVPGAQTGEDVYRAFACDKCHGPLGAGGIRNVAARDPGHQVIPALGGADFKKRLRSKDEVRTRLLEGTFVEEGRTGVLYGPAWGKIGTADQIEKVIDYIWEFGGR